MVNGGLKRDNGTRDVDYYQFGGTTGPARYPLFLNPSSPTGVSMLTIPVTKSRPSELGNLWITYTSWIIQLTKDVASIT